MAAGHVAVFGGRGFVGSMVTSELCRRGVNVLNIARRAPRAQPPPGVTFACGDALDPSTYRQHLKGARAVVISIGSEPWKFLSTPEKAVAANGDTNCRIMEAAKEENVPRVVLVNATMPAWCPKGYKQGKEQAEAAAKEFAKDGRLALVLKPGAITGTRHTAEGFPIPLFLVLAPVRCVMQFFGPLCRALERGLPNVFGGVLAPPVRVEELALSAVDFICDEQAATKHGALQVQGPDMLVGYSSNA